MDKRAGMHALLMLRVVHTGHAAHEPELGPVLHTCKRAHAQPDGPHCVSACQGGGVGPERVQRRDLFPVTR